MSVGGGGVALVLLGLPVQAAWDDAASRAAARKLQDTQAAAVAPAPATGLTATGGPSGNCYAKGYFYSSPQASKVAANSWMYCQQMCQNDVYCHNFVYWPDKSCVLVDGQASKVNSTEECVSWLQKNPGKTCEGDIVIGGPRHCDQAAYNRYPNLVMLQTLPSTQPLAAGTQSATNTMQSSTSNSSASTGSQTSQSNTASNTASNPTTNSQSSSRASATNSSQTPTSTGGSSTAVLPSGSNAGSPAAVAAAGSPAAAAAAGSPVAADASPAPTVDGSPTSPSASPAPATSTDGKPVAAGGPPSFTPGNPVAHQTSSSSEFSNVSGPAVQKAGSDDSGGFPWSWLMGGLLLLSIICCAALAAAFLPKLLGRKKQKKGRNTRAAGLEHPSEMDSLISTENTISTENEHAAIAKAKGYAMGLNAGDDVSPVSNKHLSYLPAGHGSPYSNSSTQVSSTTTAAAHMSSKVSSPTVAQTSVSRPGYSYTSYTGYAPVHTMMPVAITPVASAPTSPASVAAAKRTHEIGALPRADSSFIMPASGLQRSDSAYVAGSELTNSIGRWVFIPDVPFVMQKARQLAFPGEQQSYMQVSTESRGQD